ncbi:polysaccharide biosynthesis/export family protein [Kordiimonas sp. SCSIO 12603]|uniref:polysaccharide biosynthesis/export family protein n=1 Tax=Kordiimonas sp. SCSIO 12603 TaxID=2829596 RepID=UPI0021066D31|nr:polysaccharide biosynthesis/export family protein [Kordiimonas sp. SCSIO 12603]UTW60038.1 polysaccharide biosynthesis/export family protein [Kordiimonas sp. SCSIO 12603]
MFNVKSWKQAVIAGVAALGFSSVAAAQVAQSVEPIPEEKVETIEDRSAFGSFIFGGKFKEQSFVGFNPDYVVSTGDRVLLQLWGGFEFQGDFTVDAQGNIFVPKVGPVKLLGVRNADVNKVVSDAVKRVFRKNVNVYANLGGAEPVKVLVTGFVKQPGLFAGHASDSVLYFLDQAGGIDPARGSFLNVKVLRNGNEHRAVNIYDFILTGQLPIFQLNDGDTIVVTPVLSQAGVYGDVQNENLFEFHGPSVRADHLLALARPFPQATHVRISRNNRAKKEVEYIPLTDLTGVEIYRGDVLEVMSDKSQGTISVRIEGEHVGAQELVLPYGATMGDVLNQITFGPNAQPEAIQLLRESVKVRQKETLEAQLRALESSVLTARSKTAAEADLRQREAELILQWVERARKIEPNGQVSLAGSSLRDDILMEPGDIVRIPRRSKLVMVHGDVLFPNAMAYRNKGTVQDYINLAGGFTQSRSAANVLLLHRDGTFTKLKKSQFNSKSLVIQPGDEIFVLPKVQTKSFQLASDLINVFYQLALSAGVVLRL